MHYSGLEVSDLHTFNLRVWWPPRAKSTTKDFLFILSPSSRALLQKIQSWFPYVLLLKRGGCILQHSLFGGSLVCQWWLYHIGSTRFGWSEQLLYCWWHIYGGDAIVALNTDILFPSAEFHRERPLNPESSSTHEPLLAALCYFISWTLLRGLPGLRTSLTVPDQRLPAHKNRSVVNTWHLVVIDLIRFSTKVY